MNLNLQEIEKAFFEIEKNYNEAKKVNRRHNEEFDEIQDKYILIRDIYNNLKELGNYK